MNLKSDNSDQEPFNPVYEGLDWYVSFLKRCFLRPLKKIAGDATGKRGPLLLMYSVRNLISASLLVIPAAIFIALMSYHGISPNSSRGHFIGFLLFMPIIVTQVYFCIEGLRLVILCFNGGNGQDELHGSARSVVLLCSIPLFFSGLFMGVSLQMWFEDNIKKMQKTAQTKQDQAIYIDYLGRGREAWNAYIASTPVHSVSFAGMNLDGKDLSRHDFRGVIFTGASVKGTDFSGCHLRLARFDKANCQGAVFSGANLHMASFRDAEIEGAVFSDAFVDKADLAYARPGKPIFENSRRDFEKFTWP